MRRLFWTLSGVALGCALMWGAFQYHLVRTTSGFVLVPKQQLGLTDAYVDVRTWTISDWSKHPDLTLDVTQSGKTEVFGDTNVMKTTLKDALKFVH